MPPCCLDDRENKGRGYDMLRRVLRVYDGDGMWQLYTKMQEAVEEHTYRTRSSCVQLIPVAEKAVKYSSACWVLGLSPTSHNSYTRKDSYTRRVGVHLILQTLQTPGIKSANGKTNSCIVNMVQYR